MEHIHNQRSKFTWSDRIRVSTDIAEGMAYLHSNVSAKGNRKIEIFHQDLKSANVLLLKSDEGLLRAKVSDFGLSVMKEGSLNHSLRASVQSNATSSFSKVEHIGGTEVYMAPELKRSNKVSSKRAFSTCGILIQSSSHNILVYQGMWCLCFWCHLVWNYHSAPRKSI